MNACVASHVWVSRSMALLRHTNPGASTSAVLPFSFMTLAVVDASALMRSWCALVTSERSEMSGMEPTTASSNATR